MPESGKKSGWIVLKDQIINLASKPDKERTGLTRNSIWLGDNQTFYLTRVSRDMKRVDICSYTIGGGFGKSDH